jgi:sulfite reductase (NADPH) hemoprotein beta-component
VHDRTLQVSWESFVREHNPHLVAEVAFVGKAPGSYVMLLGGGYYGQRLNKIYRGVFAPLILFAMTEILIENVSESQILAILRPMIKRYALERLPGERFGDFTIRAGYISAVKSGKEWYDGMGGEGKYAESLL